MSGRAPQKPPKDALRILAKEPGEEHQVFRWLSVANGFPYHVPPLDEAGLFISRDGRTVYGEKFLVRVGRESHYPAVSWDYQVNAAGGDLVRKRFAYPIARSLWDYAPEVAARIGLPQRTISLRLSLSREICPRCGERAAAPLTVQGARVGYVCLACQGIGADR